MTILSQEFVFTAIDAEKAGEKFPINFDDVWQELKYTTKGNAKRVLNNELIENIDFIISDKLDKSIPSDYVIENIHLSIDGFKHFCLLARTSKGREVRKYFIDVEKDFRKKLEIQFKNSIYTKNYQDLWSKAKQQIKTLSEIQEDLEIQIKSKNHQIDSLSIDLQKSNSNIQKVKLQRDNYYDQLQTLKSANTLDLEETANKSEFPRSFATLYSHVGYKTKRYLFFNVMLDLLKLKEYVDYKFDGENYIKGKVNYPKLTLSESAFQAILAFGRPSSGLLISSETPRKLGISRSFLVKHNTSKESTNTLQPKID